MCCLKPWASWSRHHLDDSRTRSSPSTRDSAAGATGEGLRTKRPLPTATSRRACWCGEPRRSGQPLAGLARRQWALQGRSEPPRRRPLASAR
eukprot:13695181-Alexandrium_andersonii.AAC.1